MLIRCPRSFRSVWSHGDAVFTRSACANAASDLSERMGISEATLRRLERGDPGAGVGAYLTALLILGVADQATPPLPPSLWSEMPNRRVKLSRQERGEDENAEYF